MDKKSYTQAQFQNVAHNRKAMYRNSPHIIYHDGIQLRDKNEPDITLVDKVFFDDDYAAVVGPYGIAAYTFLCRWANRETEACSPSYKNIAEQTGMSRARAMISVNALADLNIILIEKRNHNKNPLAPTSNTYYLTHRSAWDYRKAQNIIAGKSPKRRGVLYGSSWQKQKTKALTRDNDTCRSCQNLQGINVHHIKPFRLFSEHRAANDLSNLVCLCKDCHTAADMIARRIFDKEWSEDRIREEMKHCSSAFWIYFD